MKNISRMDDVWTVFDPNGKSPLYHTNGKGERVESFRPIYIMPLDIHLGNGKAALEVANHICALHNASLKD